MRRMAGSQAILLLLVTSSLAAGTDGWKRPPETTGQLGIETFACVQQTDDPEGHTLLCLGIGCPKPPDYELVTIAGGGGVGQAPIISSGTLTFTADLKVDEASTASLKWEVARTPISVQVLSDLARQKALKFKPPEGIERIVPLKNFGAELKRLTRLCSGKPGS